MTTPTLPAGFDAFVFPNAQGETKKHLGPEHNQLAHGRRGAPMRVEYTEGRFKPLGSTNDYDTCQNCGKTNLKVTVALADQSSGEVVYFGRDCAGFACMGSKTADNTKRMGRIADSASRSQHLFKSGWNLQQIKQRLEVHHGFLYKIEKDGDVPRFLYMKADPQKGFKDLENLIMLLDANRPGGIPEVFINGEKVQVP